MGKRIDLLKMKLNDVIELDYNRVYIRRVHNGWIYEYTDPEIRTNDGGSYLHLKVVSAVFVPEH